MKKTDNGGNTNKLQKSRQRLYFTGVVGGGERKAKEKKKRKREVGHFKNSARELKNTQWGAIQ